MIATKFDLRCLQKNEKRLTSLVLNFGNGLQHPQLPEHIADLRAALDQNTFLEQIMISTDETGHNDELMKVVEGMMETIGRLPNLKSVLFSGSSSRGYLPVSLLVRLLASTSKLDTLVVHDVHMAGTQKDFDDLAQVVQGLWFLKRISLENFQVKLSAGTASSKHSSTASLDSLLLSFSLLPSLKTLSLCPTTRCTAASSKNSTPTAPQDPCFSLDAFSALFFSSSIQNLKLEQWGLTDEHLMAMAQVLCSGNKSLQVLTIGPVPAMTSTVAKAIARILQQSTSLVHLELALSHMLSDDVAEILARALHTKSGRTSALHTFILSGHRLGRISKKINAAFLQMMENNFSLKKCVLFRKSYLQANLAFHTRLNTLGRRTMLRLSTTNCHNKPVQPEEVWMKVLGHPDLNQDLDSIFYFLSNNPSLCARAVFNSPSYKSSHKRTLQPDSELARPASEPSSSCKRRKL
jgi:hypothetical protein